MNHNETQRRGVVRNFDAHAGLGDIESEQGQIVPFHCVSVKDGSRDIKIGTRVHFVVRFHVVRDEAFEIESVSCD